MITEREMIKALTWLMSLYSPDDYENYDEDGENGIECLGLSEVCNALRSKAQPVYQYAAHENHIYSFNYRGKELFEQRGMGESALL